MKEDIFSNGRIEGEIIILSYKDNKVNAKMVHNKVIVIDSLPINLLPLIFNSNGVIVETGSYMSHAAIFCREVGIPLRRIESALKKFKNKQKIILN
jgi:phosphohistidine swiveling domain-containing protein